MEAYLVHLSKVKYKALARYRFRRSKLPIAQWKFAQGSSLPVCTQCKSGTVADEFDILLECRKFHELRQPIIISYYVTRHTTFKTPQFGQPKEVSQVGRLYSYMYPPDADLSRYTGDPCQSTRRRLSKCHPPTTPRASTLRSSSHTPSTPPPSACPCSRQTSR